MAAAWLGCWLCSVLIWGQAWADNWPAMADTVFRRYTHEQGIPHPVVTSIAQTGDGFIWIGTENGLARWDGYRFRQYAANSGEPGSLPGNSIIQLHGDRRGRLWLLFNNGMIAWHDAQRDQFVPVPALSGNPALRLITITDAADGGLLVGTAAGLARVSEDGRKVVLPPPAAAADQPSLNDPVGVLRHDHHGRLWMATRNGLWFKPAQAVRWQPVPLPLLPAQPAIVALQPLLDGHMLISSATHGLFRVDPVRGEVKRQEIDQAAHALLTQARFISMVEVRPGEVWLGSPTQGILRLDLASGQSRRLQHDPARPTSLPGDAIHQLFIDRGGLLWVGTQRGLGLHDPGQTGVLTVFADPGQANRIQGPDVRAVLALDPRRILLGLSGQGVNLLDPQQQNVSPILPSLHKKMVQGICHVPSGDLYFATESGVVRSDNRGENPYAVPRADHSAPVQSGVVAYMAGRVWVGSVDGLWQLDPLQARPVLTRVPGSDALHGASIRSLAWDGKDALWIGSNSIGLYNYDMRLQRLSKVPLQPQAGANQFTFIATLHIDARGRLWVGSQGDGIAVLPDARHPAAGAIQLIGNAQGLPNLMVNRFVPDEQGRIWASTDGGLARIDPQTMRAEALQRADGVQIEVFWAGSGSKTAAGDIIFGGSGGITIVRPQHLKAKQPGSPPLVLTDIRQGGREVRQPPPDGTLEIPANANSLAVEFAALDFAAPERVRYAYLLEGYDDDWIKTPATRRLAAYTNLPPGQYRLHLRADQHTGDWQPGALQDANPQHRVLQIRVLPHWWQTWWVRTLFAILIVSSLPLLIHLRTRRLHERRQELEQQVRQRTLELDHKQQELIDANASLNQANGELAQSLGHLKEAQVKLLQQEKLASIGTLTAGISHEINNPTNFAHVGAYNLATDLSELHDFLWQLAGEEAEPALLAAIDERFAKLRVSLATVQEGTTRIRDLVRDLRTFSRLDMAQWTETPIGEGLRATVNLVRTQYAADINIVLDIENDPVILCGPAQLNQVFMNLIVNACQAMMARPAQERQQRPGVLRIRVSTDANDLCIDFSDNGPGIPQEIVGRIFDPFFTTKTVGEGMGMGLAISHGIIEKHHGSISVNSTPGEGTCFSLRLPLLEET